MMSLRKTRIGNALWPLPASQQQSPSQTSDSPLNEQQLVKLDTSETQGSSTTVQTLRTLTQRREGEPGESSPSANSGQLPPSERADLAPLSEDAGVLPMVAQSHPQEGEPHHVEPPQPAVMGADDDDDDLEEHQVRTTTVVVMPENTGQRRARLQAEEEKDGRELARSAIRMSWVTTPASGSFLFAAQCCVNGTISNPIVSAVASGSAFFLDSLCGQEGWGPLSWLAWGAYKFKKGEIVKGLGGMAIGVAWFVPSIALPVLEGIYQTDKGTLSNTQRALYAAGGIVGTLGYGAMTRLGFLTGSWANQRVALDDAQDRSAMEAAARLAAQPQLR